MKRKKRIPVFFTLCTFVMVIAFTQIFPKANIQSNTTSSTSNVDETEKSDSKTIVIDAGHGGYDTGCVSQFDDYEKDITLAVSLLTGEILEQNGYTVIYTRDSDEVSWSSDNRDDLRTRVSIAENANADYYISIHLNSSDYNDGAYGYEIYLDYENRKIVNMANDLLELLDDVNYSYNRGIKSTDDNTLYVVDSNDVPAMLIELGFISDQDDLNYLLSNNGQQTLAECIAQSIMLNT